MRPDFKTVGGESYDVLWSEEYVGTLYLLYREQDQLQGAFILDRAAAGRYTASTLAELEHSVERYVRHTAEALGEVETEVLFIQGELTRIVMSDEDRHSDRLVDVDVDVDDERDDAGFIYEEALEYEPLLDERLLTSGAATVHIVLARDDGDMLLYDVYSESAGAIPVGTATISTDGEHLSGYIDFRVPGTNADREYVARELMSKLQEEQTFQALHLTMMFHNEIIDELLLHLEQDCD
ncbi:hypothetical protein KIK04_18655 [Paenibacillus sp. 481]|nr:hypothetical protein KIK04_18655 [Paenibacillus sp. 481]